MDLLRLELTDLDLDIALTGSERDELDEILGLNTPEKGAPDRELSDSERDAMDQAWCRVLKDWDSIVATASERAWVATSYRKGALAVLYLRSLFFGDEIPRSATLAYTKNRAFTNGDALQFTETAKGSAPDSSGINPHRSPTPAWRWLVRI
jgi:hypothetical protein